jgi:multidrug transporter EmrE-like cation transporter
MIIGNQKLQRQFNGLLKMGVVMPETCWATYVKQDNKFYNLLVHLVGCFVRVSSTCFEQIIVHHQEIISVHTAYSILSCICGCLATNAMWLELYWNEVRICITFVMTGFNLGVKYRLILFSKYGFNFPCFVFARVRVYACRYFFCL